MPKLVPVQLLNGLAPLEWMYGIVRSYQENKSIPFLFFIFLNN